MKISLRSKTIILILLIATILSAASILVSSYFVSDIVDNNYKAKAKEICDTIATVIDRDNVETLYDDIKAIYNSTEERVLSEEWGSDAFNSYVGKFAAIESSEAYTSLMEQLRAIQEVNDVDCLYLSSITSDGYFIYLIDAALEDACPPGCLDPLYEENAILLEKPEVGYEPYFTDTGTYGRLVTAGAPIYSRSGKVIAYAMADISMDMINTKQRQFITNLAILLILITLLICVLSIIAVNRYVIRPINKLSTAASHYSKDKDIELYNEFDDIKINTNDEIETLHSSIKKMLSDIHDYIDNLMKTTEELNETRIIAEEMNELAHVDLLTGLKSRTAYINREVVLDDMILKKSINKLGVVLIDLNFLKQINDEYGHEKGDIALINAGALIREVYGNEDSYRIGGDEFAIIILDTDTIPARMDRFRKLMEEDTHTNKWEHISAASGYGIYEEGVDKSLSDVLTKADVMMYANKKMMKANR